ncbi:tRNA (guanine46-N7-)-methyltransferase [hydrothermal vent metagenome]|uniref:tRNA (guanine(46)-N(7))-methyltransferase n=1 Tax=hydrothermal vent metagenome TaxID=652676 RepID=A0A1W1BE48_9ZZZZ
MPHLVVKEFKSISLPQEVDGLKFEFLAKNLQFDNEKLIAVSSCDGYRFFLVVKEDHKKVLLKSDKTTRPASIFLLHKALTTYANLASLEVLHSNVPQNRNNPHLKETPALKEIEFFANEFPIDKEVHIEVGFGSGRHLLYQAQNNPDKLFIGLEIHRPSIQQLLKQINIKGLKNLLVIDYDARLFMEQVPSNIVGKIYVHFPVPWDKKPHRRVISKTFIAEAMRVLKVGGRLELRTDSENYYAYSYETFMSFTRMELLVKKNKEIAISSKYEDRWKRMQKNIYDLIMINDEESEPLKIEGSFDFEKFDLTKEQIKSLHGKKFIEDGYFVHFERTYETTLGGYLFKLSFGSFDRPEHLYILSVNDTLSYYPRQPLRSKANLLAHKRIKEVLDG